MSTELTVAQAQAQGQKQIGAMIESVVMQRPELKDKLNMAICNTYLRMPDASFGWVAKGEMSRELKLMAIASHLQTGAMPGYGHIYFLGNKLYQSAAFIQSKANSDPNFNIVGEAIFAPFTEDENIMYGIEKGDMACKVTLDFDTNGKTLTATGHGIVGQDEIAKGKPGLTSKKNRAMTLKTRAMRDVLSRFYPTNGVPVGPEASEEPEAIQAGYTDQLKVVEPEAIEQVREEIQAEEAVIVDEKNKDTAQEDYKKIVSEARKKKITNKDMLASAGVKNVKDLFKKEVSDAYDLLEVMQDFVDNYKDETEIPKTSPLGNPHVAAAQSRLKLQTENAGEMGLRAMDIVGDNPHNIIQRGDVREMTEASDKLVEAMKTPPVMNDDPFGDVADAPKEKPAEGKKAYDTVNMLLGHHSVTDERLKKGLASLSGRKLKAGDSELIMQAGRDALKGNFDNIDELLKSREEL